MLSKKTQYAFKALMHLSHEYNKGPVLIADIARKKKVPLKFLENILQGYAFYREIGTKSMKISSLTITEG